MISVNDMKAALLDLPPPTSSPEKLPRGAFLQAKPFRIRQSSDTARVAILPLAEFTCPRHVFHGYRLAGVENQRVGRREQMGSCMQHTGREEDIGECGKRNMDGDDAEPTCLCWKLSTTPLHCPTNSTSCPPKPQTPRRSAPWGGPKIPRGWTVVIDSEPLTRQIYKKWGRRAAPCSQRA